MGGVVNDKNRLPYCFKRAVDGYYTLNGKPPRGESGYPTNCRKNIILKE